MDRRFSRVARGAAIVLSLALAAAACGGDDSDSSSGASTTAGGSATAEAGGTATTEAKLSATLNASGATFPKAFYEEAIAAYKKGQSGVTINYAGGGSGKGRTDLQEQQVDFAGSDGLVAEADKAKYKGGEFLYFPTVAAPITVSYNVGVDDLKLSADTIAKIFQRQVTNWNDAAIAADNGGAKLPDKAIVVARRADGSGTTENFTKFLVAAAPTTWTLKSGSTVEWPADTQAAQGNAGVATLIKQTDGAIGYVDFSDAKATGLKFADVKNAAGKFVEPTLEATSAALDKATINPDLSYNPLNAPGDATYPIAAPTWILVYKNQTDKAKGEAVKSFLNFVLTDGQEMAADIDFARLPDSLVEKALAQVDNVVIPS
jgi:phosphate transport system substrate-binding protein